MSVNSKLAELFAEAVIERDSRVLSAIAPLINIPNVIDAIGKEERLFGELMKLADETGTNFLRRNTYTADDVRHLSCQSLRTNPAYNKLYLQLGQLPDLDEEGRSALVESYLCKSEHDAALEAFMRLKDASAFITKFQESLQGFAKYNQAPEFSLFALMGHPDRWTAATARLFDELGLEIPDDLQVYHKTSQNYPWTPTRFESQINAVGHEQDRLGLATPVVEISSGEINILSNKELASAFKTEYGRLHEPGRERGWNARNFPSHLPVIVKGSVSQHDLATVGAVAIEPETTKLFDDSAKHYLHHGFKDPAGRVSEADVAMAMTLLSNKQISLLIKEGGGGLYLIPAKYLPEPDDTDDIMGQQMRFHRPELIRKAVAGEDMGYSFFNRIGTFGYLRGMPLSSPSYKNCTMMIEDNLALAELTTCFSTESELEFVRGFFSGARSSVAFCHSGLGYTQERERIKEMLKVVEAHLGFEPKISITAPLQFFDELSRDSIKLPLAFGYHTDSEKPVQLFWPEGLCHETDSRMLARMGAGFKALSSKYGESPEALLTKGLRTRSDDKEQLAKILGLLEYYGLECVANSAKTPRQVEFVMEHFDLMPIADKLSAKLKRAVAAQALSQDMGL